MNVERQIRMYPNKSEQFPARSTVPLGQRVTRCGASTNQSSPWPAKRSFGFPAMYSDQFGYIRIKAVGRTERLRPLEIMLRDRQRPDPLACRRVDRVDERRRRGR